MKLDVRFDESDQQFNSQFDESDQEFNSEFDNFQFIRGEDGKSAYEVAVDNGFEGTEQEWLNSLHGKDGKDGLDGKTPEKGVDYFTTADKAEMVSAVIAALPVYDGEVETL